LATTINFPRAAKDLSLALRAFAAIFLTFLLSLIAFFFQARILVLIFF